MSMAEDEAQAAVAAAVDRLIEAARALGDLAVERRDDGVAIEGARLALRRIADPRLRDLVDTAMRR